MLTIYNSDKGAADYDSKLENKQLLINKVQELGGEFYILRKREIENYYSRDAIQRLITNEFILPPDFQIEDYTDIKEEIKTYIIQGLNINFKAKNNFSVFDEMTKEEWLACAYSIEGSTDLEIIISKVLGE
jgi:hypothetical protein